MAKWQVKHDGHWKDLDPDESQELNRRISGGSMNFRFEFKGNTYDITRLGVSGQWVQTSHATGKQRELRLWAPHGSETSRTDDIDGSMYGVPRNINELHVFEWRVGDWHPVPRKEEFEIRDNLKQGKTIFEVGQGPNKYKLDTTRRNGWVRTTLQNGAERPMKFLQTLGALGLDHLAHGRGLLVRLWHEWQDIVGEETTASAEDITRNVLKKGQAAGYPVMDQEILNLAVDDLFQKANFRGRSRLEEVDWMHFRLLQEQAPSFFAVTQVNELLQDKESVDTDFLRSLLKLFLEACRQSEDARLKPSQARQAVIGWNSTGRKRITVDTVGAYGKIASAIHHEQDVQEAADRRAAAELAREKRGCLVVARQDCQWIANFADLCLFRDPRRVSSTPHEGDATTLVAKPSSNKEADAGEDLTYYDFANIILGRRPATVQLHRYDVSKGKARWLAPLLAGMSIEGLWHTGVVVHDKEYWFGGNIFESAAGFTPFGIPDKVETIGGTMKTRHELWSYIESELVDEFNTDNYDVLAHNCNHFSNAVCMFLMNHNIPADVLQQPELLMDSWVVQLARPWLNKELGRFDADTHETARHITQDKAISNFRSTDEKRAQREWQIVRKGDIVKYEYSKGWTHVARVVGKNQETCDLCWIDLSSGQPCTQRNVSRLHVLRTVRSL